MDILHTKQTITIRYSKIFLRQLELKNRTVTKVRTDQGGELAKSSEFSDMINNEFQCGLQMTET